MRRGTTTLLLLPFVRGLHLYSRRHRGDPLPVRSCATSPTAAWRWWSAAACVAGGRGRVAGVVPLAGPENDLLTSDWFQRDSRPAAISEQRLLPSWWLSAGLLDAAGRHWSDSVLFLALMISNALFFRQLALWTAARIYRAAYSGLYGRTLRRRRARSHALRRGLSRGPSVFCPSPCDC